MNPDPLLPRLCHDSKIPRNGKWVRVRWWWNCGVIRERGREKGKTGVQGRQGMGVLI